MNRILSLLFCLAGPFLYAQYGALDPTFGNGGFVIMPLGMGNDLVIQADGKILVTGNLYDSMDHLVLIRHLSNGERDPSFGNNGIVLLPDQPFRLAWCSGLSQTNAPTPRLVFFSTPSAHVQHKAYCSLVLAANPGYNREK